MRHLPTRILGGVSITALSRSQFAELMVSDVDAKKQDVSIPPVVSFSANGEMLSMCAQSTAFGNLVSTADIVDADGQPLVLYSKMFSGQPLPERVATTDFFHDAAAAAQENDISFYFLGGTEDVMQQAATNIRNLYPSLKIAGARNGYFSDAERPAVFDEIQATSPDVLWVGMGSPRQQEFCIDSREKLPNVTWIKSCGGLFDFLAGRNSRAPMWMQNAGLEWLYRLALEPRRLFFRYALTNPHALYLLLTKSK